MARKEQSQRSRGQRRKRLSPFSILRVFVLLATYGLFAGLGAAYYGYSVVAADLPPDLNALKEPPSNATRVYSADGELIGTFFIEKRVVVPLDRIPEHVRQAFVAAEDGRFWQHAGFDPIGIVRAAYVNFRESGPKQGGSTITQQLTRLLMLDNEKSYYRKMKELILSVRVERELSKGDILEMYLNRVFLGAGHGVQAAAESYYGKDVGNLTIAEGALLAGLVQRPSAYSPFKNLKLARDRQLYVLRRMLKDGYISRTQFDAAVAEPLALVEGEVPLNHVAAPYFVEHVRAWAERRYGYRRLFEGGLNIFTTLDMRAQRSAQAAVRDGLEELDRRIGFRGPLSSLTEEELTEFRAQPPKPYIPGEESASLGGRVALLPDQAYIAAVTEITRRGTVRVAVGEHVRPMEQRDSVRLRAWRGPRPEDRRQPRQRLEVGDTLPVKTAEDRRGRPVFILAQQPEVQGALVAMDPHTGKIEAMVGGYSFRQSRFNRATQAQRQIGSAMKPFIYATAMQEGVTHLDVLPDTPVTVRTASGLWSPRNYDGEFLGPITLRTALAKSVNTISVRLVLRVGVSRIISLMRSLGIRSPIPRHVSIALGTPDLTLLEVTAALAAFPNGGKRIPTQDDSYPGAPGRFVELVKAGDGTVVDDFRDRVPTEQVISPQLAYLVAKLMEVVVERGTGRKATELGRPAAGKTGTSTGWRDAWFYGYTADRIAGVWVGRDSFKPIGARATGGSAALPIWLQFMKAAHPDTTPRDFRRPPDVTLVRADELTGEPLKPGSPNAKWVPFKRGTVPFRFSETVKSSRFGVEEELFEPTPEQLRKARKRRP